jgi:hypothetical protein
MTKAQAMVAARKLYGRNARVEFNPAALPKAEREKAAAELKAFHAQPRPKVRTEGWAEWRKQELSLKRAVYGIPCRVGEVSAFGGFGMFFIGGQGDTWEEAIEKAQQDKARVTGKK